MHLESIGIGLLFFLIANVIVGVWRKMRGGSFLPQLVDDDITVLDKNGRWWRYTPSGEWEEAFRRPERRA
jgi:hypothetical protein